MLQTNQLYIQGGWKWWNIVVECFLLFGYKVSSPLCGIFTIDSIILQVVHVNDISMWFAGNLDSLLHHSNGDELCYPSKQYVRTFVCMSAMKCTIMYREQTAGHRSDNYFTYICMLTSYVRQ